MTQRFQPGEKVRIRTGKTVFEIVEVSPVGAGSPPPPSTYLVRMRATDGRGELVYGNTALERAG